MTSPAKTSSKWSEEEKQKMHAYILNNCITFAPSDVKALAEELGRTTSTVYDQWRKNTKPAFYKQFGLEPPMASKGSGTPKKGKKDEADTPKIPKTPSPKKIKVDKASTPKKQTGDNKPRNIKKRKAEDLLSDSEFCTPPPPSNDNDFVDDGADEDGEVRIEV